MGCICEKCKYFIQHYSFESGFANKVFCGHCMKNGRKCRMSCTHTKCEQFEQNDNNVTREKLHKNVIDALTNIEYKLNDLKRFIQKDA